MKNKNVLDELMDRLNIFTKGFRIHLIEKPKTNEEVIFEIDNYQSERREEYRFFKEDGELRMERDNIIYRIEVIEIERTLLYPNPTFGTVVGTWVIEVTEIKREKT